MLTTVPLPSLVMIQAKSPTRTPGLAGTGATVLLMSPGGASTCTNATSDGISPGGSAIPGEVANTERGGVDGSPSGKQPSERGGGNGGMNAHGALVDERVGVSCRLIVAVFQRGSGLVSH